MSPPFWRVASPWAWPWVSIFSGVLWLSFQSIGCAWPPTARGVLRPSVRLKLLFAHLGSTTQLAFEVSRGDTVAVLFEDRVELHCVGFNLFAPASNSRAAALGGGSSRRCAAARVVGSSAVFPPERFKHFIF